MSKPRILFCNCTYAQVVPKEVKEAILQRLCDSGITFEAVADLCELSARRDSSLRALGQAGDIKIAACFPRAVKWLFHSAGSPLNPDQTQVLNMRVQNADEIIAALFEESIHPNVPRGKVTSTDAPPSSPSVQPDAPANP